MSDFDEDESHPIPSVDTLDVVGKFHAGGAKLVIVCGGPLEPDMRTQQRLLQKITNYQNFCLSDEFEQEFGQGPKIIDIRLAEPPHEVIELLLNECRPFLEQNGVSLIWRVGFDD